MALEIEKKFLVAGEFRSNAIRSHRMVQGYLSSLPERTVRVRIGDDHAFLTIKGKPNDTGMSRYEWEKEIPRQEALELLTLCEPGVVSKTRFIIPASGDLFFEVDEFHEDNAGLVVAEIELPREDFPFEKPAWLGQEVTNDIRYYNSYLAKHPFRTWEISDDGENLAR